MSSPKHTVLSINLLLCHNRLYWSYFVFIFFYSMMCKHVNITHAAHGWKAWSFLLLTQMLQTISGYSQISWYNQHLCQTANKQRQTQLQLNNVASVIHQCVICRQQTVMLHWQMSRRSNPVKYLVQNGWNVDSVDFFFSYLSLSSLKTLSAWS